MKKRLHWLDIVKGEGILLVILGHCLDITKVPFHLIFTFHMPLFFVLSGYVYNGDIPLKELVIKKIKTLIFPFVSFYILGLGITLVVPCWRNQLTIEGVIKDLWLADPNAVNNSSIWFLVALFFVILTFRVVKQFNIFIEIILLMFLYLAGLWYSTARVRVWKYNRLPLNWDVVLIAVVFFAVGYYFQYYKILDFVQKNRLRCYIALGIGIIATCCIYLKNGYVNMHGLNFGNGLFYFIGGICGSIAMISSALLISNSSGRIIEKVKNVLTWFGQQSIIVLGLQSVLIRLYVIIVSKFTKVNLQLYHFPMKHSIICFILVAFGICPILGILIGRIKKYK